MSYNIERLISDAKLLSTRMDDHDAAADSLINQSKQLQNRLVAMKEYQEDLTELNELARHRPRSALILGIAQENRQIRELQAENKELRMCVEEQQSALEMIMSKYRRQVATLLLSQKRDPPLAAAAMQASRYQAQVESGLLDRVCDMAAVMSHAANLEESSAQQTAEQLQRLKVENEGLRNLLKVANSFQSVDSEERLCTSGHQIDKMDSSGEEPAMANDLQQSFVESHHGYPDDSVVTGDVDDTASDVTIVDSDISETIEESPSD